MKSTLADVRQLFNVRAIAAAGLSPSAIPADTFGIVDEASDLTVSPANHAALPDSFRFVSKLGGRVYHSAGTLRRDCLGKKSKQPYRAEVTEHWSATIAHCGCLRTVSLGIHIGDERLLRNHGLTWADRDTVFVATREELEAQCECAGGEVHETYQNHVATKLLWQKITAENSPFYRAYVEDESGNGYDTLADIEAFIASNKAVNTDGNPANDSDKLVLYVAGKLQPPGSYADLEANYVYPRGVSLLPSATVNGGIGIAFTKVSPLVYPMGDGYDLRAEEFAAMSLWTGLNHYPQISCGLPSKDLAYQFENGKKYHTVGFEACAEKSGLEDVHEGNARKWHVTLGTEDPMVYSQLAGIFG